jgi:hypothetical protein
MAARLFCIRVVSAICGLFHRSEAGRTTYVALPVNSKDILLHYFPAVMHVVVFV